MAIVGEGTVKRVTIKDLVHELESFASKMFLEAESFYLGKLLPDPNKPSPSEQRPEVLDDITTSLEKIKANLVGLQELLRVQSQKIK